ncbi:MAG TPA: cupin domain-containing protein [Geminicoccaceae bacterium]|nr:cupin domain-containing protein [Geminicoccaceae bacterium]
MPVSTHRSLLLAGLVAGATLAASGAASAGECPNASFVPDGLGQKPGATMPKGVTDMVLGSIDLANEPVAVQDRLFRLRRLVIEPGGEVPWHSHDDRPALIYVVAGEVTEYASNCEVPIVHKAGEVAPETKGTSHWWKNTGDTTAVLISADLLREEADAHVM